MTAAQQIMMAMSAIAAAGVSFVASANASGSSAPTVSKPTGTTQGDLMIMVCATNQASGSFTPPAGWVDLYGTGSFSGVCAKFAGASEPSSYTYGNSASSQVTVIVTYRNCWMGAVNTATGAASSTSVAAASIDPIQNNSLLLAMFAATGTVSFTPPSGMSALVSLGTPRGLLVATQSVNLGSTGTKTATASGTADLNAGMLSLTPRVSGSYNYWDVLAKSGPVILSAGNLVATGDNSPTNESVRGVFGTSTGKAYWTQYGGNNFGIGNDSQSLAVSAYPGNSSNSAAYNRVTGEIYANGATVTTVATAGYSDIIGMALDATAKTIAWYKNGTLLYTYTYSFTGIIYPISTVYSNVYNPQAVNFGQVTLTPPGGFPAGFIY